MTKKPPQLHFEKTSMVFLHVKLLERCFFIATPAVGWSSSWLCLGCL